MRCVKKQWKVYLYTYLAIKVILLGNAEGKGIRKTNHTEGYKLWVKLFFYMKEYSDFFINVFCTISQLPAYTY